ncbi:MAG: hypothetical protein H7251_15175 [Acetobacteraceae bacterium]|nr:hypothetical protein [Acetobacteraceae bacterium]
MTASTDAARFIKLVGAARWRRRMAEVAAMCGAGGRAGRAALQRHLLELTIDRLTRAGDRALAPSETAIIRLAQATTVLAASLAPDGRARLLLVVQAALVGESTLVPLFHMMRTAAMQRARGFEVRFAGLADVAPFDLLITREGAEAEIVCDIMSAEDGREVHRGAWVQLVDRIDPDLQTWLGAHPGRYLLKMTLPQGLKREPESLASLHARIKVMLSGSTRQDQDAAAVLRLDPLMLAASQADEAGLLAGVRREFGNEAHLAVTAAGQGVFVLAARAGRENEIAVAMRHRLEMLAPARLSGTRPGILAMFIEDTDRAEWGELRDRLRLEAETRQFLAYPSARQVVAVTCASRHEMLADAGELRFRNTGNAFAKVAALAPAVMSTM